MFVHVYRNSRKKCWSVKSMEGKSAGKVVYHLDKLYLISCRFVVSESGRQRVLKQKRKNVHAYVQGHYFPDVESGDSDYIGEILYNPYKHETFMLKQPNMPLEKAIPADKVDFDSDGVTCWKRRL